MINIFKSQEITSILPDLKLGCIYYESINTDLNYDLCQLVENETKKISDIDISKIKNIPQIASSREAYKKLGKEPSRYRLSAEALYRRIINQKNLYKINTAVDLINYLSIKTGYSIGGYDFEKIVGDIYLRKGRIEDIYHAIGRGIFNVENLPVFADDLGAFGSPTSDSERTSITLLTKKILMIVLNFGNHQNFSNEIDLMKITIEKIFNTTNCVVKII